MQKKWIPGRYLKSFYVFFFKTVDYLICFFVNFVYSKVANKRAGANKSAWWIFLRKSINVQGQISMQWGKILTLKNMQGEITYIYFKFFEHFPHLATFNWSLTYKIFFIMTIYQVLYRIFSKKKSVVAAKIQEKNKNVQRY